MCFGSSVTLDLASSRFFAFDTALQETFLSTVLTHLAVEQAATPHTVQHWPWAAIRNVSHALQWSGKLKMNPVKLHLWPFLLSRILTAGGGSDTSLERRNMRLRMRRV